HRGPDLHLRDRADERREEHHAVGYILGSVGKVLAAVSFRISQPVGKNEGLAILLERFDIATRRRMDRHREKAKLHGVVRKARAGPAAFLSCRPRLHKSPSPRPAILRARSRTCINPTIDRRWRLRPARLP